MKKFVLFLLSLISVCLLTGCEEDVNYSEDVNEDEINKAVAYYSTDTENKVEKKTEKEKKNDVLVIGDDYFATQIADMQINYKDYVGKTVVIEGFSLINPQGPYTFVGRYSENAACPSCPPGYAYYEYEWHDGDALALGNEEKWIKITGDISVGNDGVEYPYINVSKLEVMDEWGQKTVTN